MTTHEEKDSKSVDPVKKDGHQEDNHNILPDEIFPEGMPQEAKRSIQMAMRTTQLVNGSRSSHHPLLEKFTPEHIDKYLDGIQQDDNNDFALQRSGRWFTMFYVVLGVSFILFLLIYVLPKDRAFLEQLLKLTIAFAGGAGSGYGYKNFKDNRR